MTALLAALAVAYLLLHAGPMLGAFHRPSIAGGTRWSFFLSEVFLFCAVAQAWPDLATTWWGPTLLVFHISSHLLYAAADALAHDRLVAFAMADRKRQPVRWALKAVGLAADAAAHAIFVVWVLARLPTFWILVAMTGGAFVYVITTSAYVREAKAAV